jgi:hypothetical protein
MNPIREYLDYGLGLVRRWFRRPLRGVVRVGSLPSLIAPHAVYILTEDGEAWQASMFCPCGCGAILEMNLLPDDKPVWNVSIASDGTPTLRPSVWRQVGCKSHFFVRDGRVIWCD